ncbi:glycoside hydrolase family 9 protein [Conexibacter woesei]|uniref:Uncharacterized protein n=1 Tax=Conexibacter woesei (strain DSM 14684 / CCUG 47730 / CIP 108061 / JCM 11494 / NBRC 100937 / ID131577) TaxID=469383 RepID=D3F3N2_CONWI|nr:glycoside hydrolase family 9 protein [Conexibacter woesei]ADB52397.1 hypothetical protein Cwoe_3980 [Conexibacter woesei DSM 14684]
MASLLVSQLGLRPEDPKVVVVRADAGDAPGVDPGPLVVSREERSGDGPLAELTVTPWGELWGTRWWTADLGALREPGRYRLTLGSSHATLEIAADALVAATLLLCSADNLDARVGGKLGWQDCAFDGRGVESHAVMVLGLADALETFGAALPALEAERLRAHLAHGAEYLTACQRDDGSFMNEHYIAREHTVWHLCALATLALARASQTLAAGPPLEAAKRGWAWCTERAERPADAVRDEIAATRAIFGQYPPWLPPAELRTRDLLVLVAAGAELYRGTNDLRYRRAAIAYAAAVAERQRLDPSEHTHGLYGHFRAWAHGTLAQRAWEHVGWGYNCGAVLPDELSGVAALLDLFPDDADADRWRALLRRYAEGYLKPACALSPFSILPLGDCEGEVRFFGPAWHGFNGAYARMARTCMVLARQLQDPALEALAVRQLQWIAGANAGVPDGEGGHRGVSMIAGVGEHAVEVLSGIAGSIANGFSATPQFQLVHLDDLADRPAHLTNEDWILHNGAWLSGLAAISARPRVKVKAMLRGEPVAAHVSLALGETSIDGAVNERGVLVAEQLPRLSEGTVRVAWEELAVELPVAPVAGATLAVVVDFADALELTLAGGSGEELIAAVANRGRDASSVHVSLCASGVVLERDELELELAPGEVLPVRVGCRLDGAQPRAAWVRAVARSAWSEQTAETWWI